MHRLQYPFAAEFLSASTLGCKMATKSVDPGEVCGVKVSSPHASHVSMTGSLPEFPVTGK